MRGAEQGTRGVVMLGVSSVHADEAREGNRVSNIKAKHLFKVWMWNFLAQSTHTLFLKFNRRV